jgi:hypothetical protein
MLATLALSGCLSPINLGGDGWCADCRADAGPILDGGEKADGGEQVDGGIQPDGGHDCTAALGCPPGATCDAFDGPIGSIDFPKWGLISPGTAKRVEDPACAKNVAVELGVTDAGAGGVLSFQTPASSQIGFARFRLRLSQLPAARLVVAQGVILGAAAGSFGVAQWLARIRVRILGFEALRSLSTTGTASPSTSMFLR